MDCTVISHQGVYETWQQKREGSKTAASCRVSSGEVDGIAAEGSPGWECVYRFLSGDAVTALLVQLCVTAGGEETGAAGCGLRSRFHMCYFGRLVKLGV